MAAKLHDVTGAGFPSSKSLIALDLLAAILAMRCSNR